MNFTLGTTLRDRASGFTGTATGRVDFLTGNVQYNLQPPAKDGVLPDVLGFDAHQLEEAPGTPIPYVPAPADIGFALGEKVKDIISGAEGIAVRKTVFLNGCVYVSVQEQKLSKEGLMVEHFLEWKRWKRVSTGVTRLLAAAEPKKAARPPGGPVSRNMPVRG